MAQYKFYGKYKNVRNAAWHVLLDFGVSSLPVSTIKIATGLGVKAISYDAGKDIIEKFGLENVCKANNGFSLLLDTDCYIFFNDTIHPRTRIRFTIAHELGHILLGHELKLIETSGGSFNFIEENVIKERKKPSESEADMFALRLLAPASVLWGLDIKEPEDISTLCGICLTESKIRAKRMDELYQRGKFLTNDLEKQVFEQFKSFIESTKRNY